jgi:hypothetical protein
LEDITPAVARALAERRLNHLCEGLDDSYEDACQAVVDDPILVDLDRVTHLSVASARELAKHPGALSLVGLESLTDEVAEELSRLRGTLRIRRGIKLSTGAMKILRRHQGVCWEG